jgi:endonuclease G
MKLLLILASLLTFIKCRNDVVQQDTLQHNLDSIPKQKPIYSKDYLSCESEFIEHKNFSLCYAEEHEQASWASYVLTKSETEGSQKRTNDFRIDPLVSTVSATKADYKASGFDRGHLAPAADMAFSLEAMSESFYLSNMSPQNASFNRGIWKRLESQVREWASIEDSIIVITGPILRPGLEKIPNSKVSIPQKYFKALFDLTPPHKAIAFVLNNEGSKKELEEFVVSVDELESLLEKDLFPKNGNKEIEQETIFW